MPSAPFLGKRILFVTAHPDDESYALAGTILRNQQKAGQSFIICATYGEQGKTHFKTAVSRAFVKRTRKLELEKACKLLKVSKTFALNLPDTQLDACRVSLKNKIAAIASQLELDYIASFGADGISGHKDHIVVGNAARQIAKLLKIPLIEFCGPPSYYTYMDHMKQRRKFGRYARNIVHPVPNVKIKIDPANKLRVLATHKSQHKDNNPFLHMPDQVVYDFLHYEYFKI